MHINRVLIVNDGKVVKGMESVFQAYAGEEGQKLKKIFERILEDEKNLPISEQLPAEDLEKIRSRTFFEWQEEGAKSLVSAAFRFGAGSISLDRKTFKRLQKKSAG